MKIGIVGSGLVGSTAAYALVMQGIGRSVVLVDLNEARARAEADDILHAVPFAHPMQVSAGDYGDLAGSRVVIITAGVSQRRDETRLQLLERNAAVFQQVIPQILRVAPEAILLVATNPVDIMTHLTAHYAAEFGVPSGRVVGSGTTLDTARFRTLLGAHFGVDPHHVHGYVVGEHGDSEVLTWSLVTVGGTSLDDFCRLTAICLDEAMRQAIDDRVRRAAYNIIAGKGATYYGVGGALARIVDVVVHDQRAILTVCTPMPEIAGVEDVTVALPHLVGGEGVLATLPLALNKEEATGLNASARLIRDVIDALEVSE
jgi:L-lactate dehydrogenase